MAYKIFALVVHLEIWWQGKSHSTNWFPLKYLTFLTITIKTANCAASVLSSTWTGKYLPLMISSPSYYRIFFWFYEVIEEKYIINFVKILVTEHAKKLRRVTDAIRSYNSIFIRTTKKWIFVFEIWVFRLQMTSKQWRLHATVIYGNSPQTTHSGIGTFFNNYECKSVWQICFTIFSYFSWLQNHSIIQ